VTAIAGPQARALFQTPVIVDHMPDHEALNRDLRGVIARQRADSKGVQFSNVGGWQSDTFMLKWGGEPAMKLVERIVAAVDHFTIDVKSEGQPRYRWFPEMWANVSPPRASNQYHSHPGAFWAAVYYVDDGFEGASDPALGGELLLLDPRMPAIRMNAPDLRFRNPGAAPDHHEAAMRPQTGRIVIFPGWLSHAVRPYRGRAERISVAVNLSAVPLSVPGALI
jgi:uncharacterized protein (TIGR02466 family)